jgi:hypothetical protein
MRPFLALTVMTALALTSCSGDKNSPEDAAGALASGLSSGKLTGAFASDQKTYDAIVAGLGDEADAEVKVSDVDESSDDAATATLSWTWKLGDDAWTYDTKAALKRSDGSWTASFAPSVVEPSLGDGDRLSATTLAAKRGDITGAGGVALVKPRRVERFGLDKSKLSPPQAVAAARRIATVLDISAAPYVKLVKASGPKAFVEAITLRPADARQVPDAFGDIKGALAIGDTLPLAPTREFAAPVLGRVGPATAEIVKDSGGRVQAGDEVGLSGLEQRYDEQLAGVKGLRVDVVRANGDTHQVYVAHPEDGQDLATTLDERLQSRAEQVLAVPDPDNPGPATALVAIKPSTGAILAAASGAGAEGQNIATYGQYAPGSTFKVVSSLALLRAGLTPQSEVSCPPTVDVDGKQFKNYSDYPSSRLGTITLRDAVANSCNTAFISSRGKVGRGDLAGAAASLGAGVDHDLGFPAYFGQVPPPASETEAAADLIGQGKVLASPMTMATVAASVAAGRTVVPYLLDDVRPEAQPDTALSKSEATALRGMMRAVVTEGSGSLLAGLPGSVGAKTGTAEYGSPGEDGAAAGALPTHAWMIATQGDLAVAVFVETGESGSQSAGPLLLKFLQG